MTHENIIESFNGSHWAMRYESVLEVRDVASRISLGVLLAEKHKREKDEQAQADNYDPFQAMYSLTANGTAIVPVVGKMMPRANLMSMLSGGVSTEMLTKLVGKLDADEDVNRVLFKFSSPGGTIEGLTDLTEAIRSMSKPTVSVSAGGMYSAAYWVGSAADKVYATPVGGVGSIGVYTMVVSEKERLEEEGIDVQVIRSTPLKAKGQISEPIDEETVKVYQEQVDAVHRAFAEDVAINRNLSLDYVLENMATGETKMGKDAEGSDYVDGVKTLNEVLADFDIETDSPKTETEQAFDHLQGEYEALVSRHEDLQAEYEQLQEEVEASQEADMQAKIDAACDTLIEDQQKVAPAKREKLEVMLRDDFQATMDRFDLVEAGAAAPKDFPETDEASDENLESAIQKARSEGKLIAEDEQEAQTYRQMGRDFVMVDDLL